MEKLIEMRGITKAFGTLIANNNINIDLLKGETLVLLGENGAGKTTLMNILYGLYEPDKGDITINGKEEKIKSPSDAIKCGIGMVHQHFMLINNFTVTENIILGKEPKKSLKIDIEKGRKDVENLSEKYGFNINPDEIIENLSVGQQQKVEILKVLYRGAEILILDEPTAVLTPQEIDELGMIIDNLKKEGKSVILITHKLKEVMGMSDRVTIIRKGEVIDTLNTKDTNIDELAELMVGRKVSLTLDKTPCNSKGIALEIKNLQVKNSRGSLAVKDASFTVKHGEIFGIAGVDGNGQKELVEAIFALDKVDGGEIVLNGENITNNETSHILSKGISHIPEDRHKRGLILNYSLYENSILGNHKKFSHNLIMDYGKIKKYTKEIIKEFDVRCESEEVEASTLSGGNQQKFIVGREIFKNPNVLVACQPTRGIDVGAIEYIHKRLLQERDNGKAILLVSLELDEILELSDRIGVIYDGRIVAILDRKDASEKTLGILMAGGSINNLPKRGETGGQ